MYCPCKSAINYQLPFLPKIKIKINVAHNMMRHKVEVITQELLKESKGCMF